MAVQKWKKTLQNILYHYDKKYYIIGKHDYKRCHFDLPNNASHSRQVIMQRFVKVNHYKEASNLQNVMQSLQTHHTLDAACSNSCPLVGVTEHCAPKHMNRIFPKAITLL